MEAASMRTCMEFYAPRHKSVHGVSIHPNLGCGIPVMERRGYSSTSDRNLYPPGSVVLKSHTIPYHTIPTHALLPRLIGLFYILPPDDSDHALIPLEISTSHTIRRRPAARKSIHTIPYQQILLAAPTMVLRSKELDSYLCNSARE